LGVRRTIAVAVPTAPSVINAPPTGSCHEEVSFPPAFTAAGIGPGVRLGVVRAVVRCCATVVAEGVMAGCCALVVVRWVLVVGVVVFVLVDVEWVDVLLDVVVSVIVETLVETLVEASGVVLAALIELCSAEAGRAEAITRAAPTTAVPHPAAMLQTEPRGDVGGLLMMSPSTGQQLTCRTA
jgi:hypothetical protein